MSKKNKALLSMNNTKYHYNNAETWLINRKLKSKKKRHILKRKKLVHFYYDRLYYKQGKMFLMTKKEYKRRFNV